MIGFARCRTALFSQQNSAALRRTGCRFTIPSSSTTHLHWKGSSLQWRCVGGEPTARPARGRGFIPLCTFLAPPPKSDFPLGSQWYPQAHWVRPKGCNVFKRFYKYNRSLISGSSLTHPPPGSMGPAPPGGWRPQKKRDSRLMRLARARKAFRFIYSV